MSDKLLIEQMTEQVETEVEKTAEEAEFEKVASVYNVVEQARALTSVGEEMYKIASEIESEPLAALAVDTYTLGERMGSCLSKTASEDNSSLEEALEIAGDMYKVASAYATIADEIKDEEFGKLAEAVIDISNEMTEEANEVIGQIEKEAEVEKEAGVKDTALKAWGHLKGFGTKASAAGAKAADKTGKAFNFHSLKESAKRIQMEAARGGDNISFTEGMKRALKAKGGVKKNLKAPAIAYGSAIAALTGAGYGVKKATDKK